MTLRRLAVRPAPDRPDPPRLAEQAAGAGPLSADPTPTVTPAAWRPEPHLGGSPLLVEFGEPQRREFAAADTAQQRQPTAARRATLPFGIIGSLGMHLLPLLVLLEWTRAAPEVAAPIPVQLVIVQPPAPPLPPKPPPEKKKPPGRLASDDMGRTAPQPKEAAAPAPPAPKQLAEIEPPKPVPVPDLSSALPNPDSPPEPIASPPHLTPPVKRPVKRPVVARLPPSPHPAPHVARIPGPDATRDEYFAYCFAMIQRYYDMMPASLLTGRTGVAVLSIVILDDGTIAQIAVVRGSGYKDIDARLEQMVAAVRRFPPLPQWFQGSRMPVLYHQVFRDGALIP